MKIESKEQYIEKAKKEGGVQTSCDNCAFFVPAEINEGLGDLNKFCKSGRLQKFESVGSEIIWVKADEGDEKISSIIPKRVCNMMRSYDWKDLKEEKKDKEQTLEQIARDECKIQCNMFLFVEHDENTARAAGDDIEEQYFKQPSLKESLEEIEKKTRQISKKKIASIARTIKSAQEADIPPVNITIINTCIKPYDFINYLRRELESLSVLAKWNMEYTDLKDYDYEEAKQALLYSSSKNINTQYFCTFCEGDEIPKDYLSNIDSIINDDLEQLLFAYNEDDDVRGAFIQSAFYKRAMTFDKNIILENEECRKLCKKISPKIQKLQ